VNGAVDFLTRLGPARIAAMGVVTFALVGFFAFVIMRVSQPAMGVLFAELSLQDANAVMKDLDARAIRYETRGDGQTILVPRQDLARIRMELAGKGLPSGGGVGYEIFDKGDAFSSTSFVQASTISARSRASCRAPSARSAGSRARASISSCLSGACSSATASRRGPRSC
jgi:flagellar M-ring protein FliF